MSGPGGPGALMGLRPTLPALQPGPAKCTHNTDFRRPLSAWLPHELSPHPDKSRNVFHDCPHSQQERGWGAACPDPITLAQSGRSGQTLAEGPLQTEPLRALFSELCLLGKKLGNSAPSGACWPGLCLLKGHPPDHLFLTQTGRGSCQWWPRGTSGHRKQTPTWLTCFRGTYGDPESADRI